MIRLIWCCVLLAIASTPILALSPYEQSRRQLGEDLMQQQDNWERSRRATPSRPQSRPLRQRRFGAIAVSRSTGAVGWSHGQPAARDAEEYAQEQCKSHAPDCQAVLSWGNGCGTLVLGSRFTWAAESAPTREEAEARAVAECGTLDLKCRPIRTVCTR